MANFVRIGEAADYQDHPSRVEIVNTDQVQYLAVEWDTERQEPLLKLYLARDRWVETRGTQNVRATLERLHVQYPWPQAFG